jgi:hypothetical protein
MNRTISTIIFILLLPFILVLGLIEFATVNKFQMEVEQ